MTYTTCALYYRFTMTMHNCNTRPHLTSEYYAEAWEVSKKDCVEECENKFPMWWMQGKELCIISGLKPQEIACLVQVRLQTEVQRNPKFHPTHDLQILTVHFMSLR